MCEIAHFDCQLADHVSVRAVQLEAPDVGPRRGDRSREVRVEPTAVGGFERQTHHEFLTFQLLPIYLEATLGLLNQHQQVGTIRAMDAHPPAPSYIPHNRVAGYGLTTLGVADHHAVDALDADPLGGAADFVHQPVERAGLRRLWRAVGLGIKLLQYLRHVDVALTDRSDQMVEIGEVEGLGDFQQVAVFGLRQPAALDLAVQDLTTQLDRCSVLLDAEALPDLVTGAAGAHVGQPVPTGFRGRGCDDLHRLRVF